MPVPVIVLVVLVLVLEPLVGVSHPMAAPRAAPIFNQPERVAAIYGDQFHPRPYQPDGDRHSAWAYVITPQGNDSNCDFLAVANGIQNIGGDGGQAYWLARQLVPQRPRDYKESYYTVLGSDGSDQRFSLDNLGAAPEAFVGVYEALGYDAVMLAAPPHVVDSAFARAVYERLAAQPMTTFAHLWITPRPYNAQARVLTLEETGEQVPLLYPYHEVAALVTPDTPDHVIILDGLVGYPYALSLADLAVYLRGFNRALVVQATTGGLAGHQQAQHAVTGQAYVTPTLGGSFLLTARQTWGPGYRQWGQVIGQPYRVTDGATPTVRVPGMYVQYERIGAQDAALAPLGLRMWHDLHQAGLISGELPTAGTEPALVNGIHAWVLAQFGSVDQFERAFGRVLTAEVWVTPAQMHALLLRGVPYPPIDSQPAAGYICVITAYAVLVWEPQQGVFLLPLGLVYDQHP